VGGSDCALPAAGFADDSDNLALIDCEAGVSDRGQNALSGMVFDLQILDFKYRGHGLSLTVR
jgi:hypothetical protein